jgi:hypothetical protein
MMPVWRNGGWKFEELIIDTSGASLEIDPTQLIDGATVTVPMEEYVTALTRTKQIYSLTIVTMDASGNTIMLPCQYLSAPADGYPATVKCFDPAGNGVITVTLIPG